MRTTIHTILLTLVMALASATAASAQSSIDKIIEPLKDDNTGSQIAYQEKRDPSTKEIVESSLYLDFSDEKLARKLIDAFKKERVNATEYMTDSQKGQQYYRIKFVGKDNKRSEYNLYQTRSKWQLMTKVTKPGQRAATGTTPSRRRR